RPSTLWTKGNEQITAARARSQVTMTFLRSQRSIITPVTGARKKPGTMRADITRPTAAPPDPEPIDAARIVMARKPSQSPSADTTCAIHNRKNAWLPNSRTCSATCAGASTLSSTRGNGTSGTSTGWAAMNGTSTCVLGGPAAGSPSTGSVRGGGSADDRCEAGSATMFEVTGAAPRAWISPQPPSPPVPGRFFVPAFFAVFFAAAFFAAAFFAGAFFAAVFLAAFFAGCAVVLRRFDDRFAGAVSRRIWSSSLARSTVTPSMVSPLRSEAFVSPSVTYGP